MVFPYGRPPHSSLKNLHLCSSGTPARCEICGLFFTLRKAAPKIPVQNTSDRGKYFHPTTYTIQAFDNAPAILPQLRFLKEGAPYFHSPSFFRTFGTEIYCVVSIQNALFSQPQSMP